MANIIITESQLDIIREYEEVLHDEFEKKVRGYMKELYKNPCHPKLDEFFVNNGVPEDILQNRMLDLGIIKKDDNITEPEDANGHKHGVHTRSFTFNNSGFNDKIDKLYDEFKKGKLRK